MPDTPRSTQISVSSELTPEGSYLVTVQPSPDVAVPLERDRAFRYGLTVLTAVQYADYEAGIWAQMQTAGIDTAATADALTALRKHRTPLDHEATAPLSFEPILSARTRAGMIKVLLNGEQIAQLETTAAAQHGRDVLTLFAVAELDALYYRWLRDGVTDEPTARWIISELSKHHPAAAGDGYRPGER